MRILLIEDDRRLLESLKFQLEKEDFTVDACTTGDDGLYFVLQGAYDLVILDRMLPGMDGISLLRRLRREGGAVPVKMCIRDSYCAAYRNIFFLLRRNLRYKNSSLREVGDQYGSAVRGGISHLNI